MTLSTPQDVLVGGTTVLAPGGVHGCLYSVPGPAETAGSVSVRIVLHTKPGVGGGRDTVHHLTLIPGHSYSRDVPKLATSAHVVTKERTSTGTVRCGENKGIVRRGLM